LNVENQTLENCAGLIFHGATQQGQVAAVENMALFLPASVRHPSRCVGASQLPFDYAIVHLENDASDVHQSTQAAFQKDRLGQVDL
jgi:hypothetical protein